MRKRHFKLGMVILIGLAGYFLALSAVLVASAGIFDGSGLSPNVGRTPHLRTDLPRKRLANFRSGGKSVGHESGVHAAGTRRDKGNPCLVSACGGSAYGKNADASLGWSGSGLGGSLFSNGQDGGSGGRNLLYPTPYGLNLFGDGTAFGLSDGAGENGGATQNDSGASPAGVGVSTGEVSPGFTDSDPEPNLLSITPAIPALPQISQFQLDNPPGSGDPVPSTGNLPSDPTPQFDPPGTYTVPEPPTFWLFLASLIAVVATLRLTVRARPTALDDVGDPMHTGIDGKSLTDFRTR